MVHKAHLVPTVAQVTTATQALPALREYQVTPEPKVHPARRELEELQDLPGPRVSQAYREKLVTLVLLDPQDRRERGVMTVLTVPEVPPEIRDPLEYLVHLDCPEKMEMMVHRALPDNLVPLETLAHEERGVPKAPVGLLATPDPQVPRDHQEYQERGDHRDQRGNLADQDSLGSLAPRDQGDRKAPEGCLEHLVDLDKREREDQREQQDQLEIPDFLVNQVRGVHLGLQEILELLVVMGLRASLDLRETLVFQALMEHLERQEPEERRVTGDREVLAETLESQDSQVQEVKWVRLVPTAETESLENQVPPASRDPPDLRESEDSEESQGRGGHREKLGPRGLPARPEPTEIPVFPDLPVCLDQLGRQGTLVTPDQLAPLGLLACRESRERPEREVILARTGSLVLLVLLDFLVSLEIREKVDQQAQTVM